MGSCEAGRASASASLLFCKQQVVGSSPTVGSPENLEFKRLRAMAVGAAHYANRYANRYANACGSLPTWTSGTPDFSGAFPYGDASGQQAMVL